MSFEYEIKKSKGRNVRISVTRRAEVFLHVPRFVPQFVAKRFLESKKDWVEKTLVKIKQIPVPVGEDPGEGLTKRELRKKYLENRENARKLVHEKLLFWQKFYQDNFRISFNWNKVAIKNSKTRWGSCSSKKNLNFSYKIISLSDSAQNYLIVHELSHLIEMNHSKNFWGLVSLGVPEYRKYRKELKSHIL